MSQIDFNKEFRIYKNLLELLKCRKYIVDEEKEEMSIDQFTHIYTDNPQRVQIFHRPNEEDTNKGIAVILNLKRHSEKGKVDKELVQGQAKQFRANCSNFLYVVKTEGKNQILSIDKKAQQAADSLEALHLYVQFFKQSNLMFNIMNHQLVPLHQIQTPDEKAALLKKYKVKDSQLPKILLTDPVAEFLGLRRGDVVKITRKSQTAGTYITYRIAC